MLHSHSQITSGFIKMPDDRSAVTLPDKHLVAIIDGNEKHRSEVGGYLQSYYRVIEFGDSDHAFHSLHDVQPDLVLLGEHVAPLDGYQTARRLRRISSDLPVVIIVDEEYASTKRAVQRCGINSYLAKPYRRSALLHAISSLCNAAVETRWEELPDVQRRALKGTLQAYNHVSDFIAQGRPIAYAMVTEACAPLVEAVNKRDFKSILEGVKGHDNYSYVHCLRVATLLSLFGFAVGLSEVEQELLASGGLLHDVGKMSIPYEVLNKPGQLSDGEFAVMRGHVLAGVRYLHSVERIPKGVITIAEQHHERLDGSGYPYGLDGSQLNELARIAAIADVFGALTDRRVYKPAMPPDQALKLMTEEMSAGLDLHLVSIFRQALLDAAFEEGN